MIKYSENNKDHQFIVGEETLKVNSSNDSIAQAMEIAVEHQIAGRLIEAEKIFQKVLEIDPCHPDALHLVGVIAHQVGKHDIAIELIMKAVAVQPTLTHAFHNLGSVYRSIENHEAAIASYQRAISLDPTHAKSHLSLGNLYLKEGRGADAVDSYRHYLRLVPESAEAYNNLGCACHTLEDFEQAIGNFKAALSINPNYTRAYFNLANTYFGQRDYEKSLKEYECALVLDPGNISVLNNLGRTYQEMGALVDAEQTYRNIIKICPDNAEAHHNLGSVLSQVGASEEAIASYQLALDQNPDSADTLFNLGVLLQSLSRPDEAFGFFRRSIDLRPAETLYWSHLAESLEPLSFSSADESLLSLLTSLLEKPTTRTSFVVMPILSALGHHPVFSQIMDYFDAETFDREIDFLEISQQLTEVPLFLKLIKSSPIFDSRVEVLLTRMRESLLFRIVEPANEIINLKFPISLALHCFSNEYVFIESKAEERAVRRLEQKIASLVNGKIPVPSALVVAMGSYRPLYKYSWAEIWAENVAHCSGNHQLDLQELIARQISEPLIEQGVRKKIASLTSIRGAVSNAVRSQYEENPYPRWVQTGLKGQGLPICVLLTGTPHNFDLGNYVAPEEPDVLIAGCGTGQQALLAASRYSNSNVFGIDLSLSSLAYALRKTKELQVPNIQYAQADIMELNSWNRKFDVIESVGVLHHLKDPLAGWKNLVDLLHPKGVMKIGLYSETARQDIIQGRELISRMGFSAAPDDIRECRQVIIKKAAAGDKMMAEICNRSDFYSLSNVRDLLFHVQEHRFTLPQLEATLEALNLKFLGFEIRNHYALIKEFQSFFPNNWNLASLKQWHQFETETTHEIAYSFWCQKC